MREISTDDAPGAIGPYSQGIVDGETVYVSGQGPVDPGSGEIVGEDVGEQTEQTLENVGAILEAAGSSLDDVVKATVFVTDMDDYEAVNEVYGEYMSDPYPARSAVQVVELPIDIDVEIEAIATLSP
jgi:2-iminobutanoate/2-iminopropanoate deaminase